mmetsp:Transcript_78538/g.123918  ORF Transcript_78538/g.123918 Transcript_78538/m.123918 type:complete len:265 (-) Transcript_78538:1001-1795(-)
MLFFGFLLFLLSQLFGLLLHLSDLMGLQRSCHRLHLPRFGPFPWSALRNSHLSTHHGSHGVHCPAVRVPGSVGIRLRREAGPRCSGHWKAFHALLSGSRRARRPVLVLFSTVRSPTRSKQERLRLSPGSRSGVFMSSLDEVRLKLHLKDGITIVLVHGDLVPLVHAWRHGRRHKVPSIGEPGAVHRQRGAQRGHGFILAAIIEVQISWQSPKARHRCEAAEGIPFQGVSLRLPQTLLQFACGAVVEVHLCWQHAHDDHELIAAR